MFILALKCKEGLGVPEVICPPLFCSLTLPEHTISNTGETRMDKDEYLE